MKQAVALILTDLEHGRLGHKARLDDELAGRSVLAHTVERVRRIAQVDRVVLVHPQGQDPSGLADGVETFADAGGLRDDHTAQWVSARKIALGAWRGGLGQATCYDELLPAGPLAAAAEQYKAESAFIVRGDWCCFDVQFAAEQLKRHLEHPKEMRLTFTQAPPGLSGLAIEVETLRQIAEHRGAFAPILAYNPRKARIDPIGRDVNVPIPASVRDCQQRFIYDTPRAVDRLRAIADRLGDRFADADAQAITDAARAIDEPLRLPPHITLELTPRREPTGPITPQHYTAFERPDMDEAHARRLIDQVAEEPDAFLVLGGLGDALLHPAWEDLVQHAHDAGAFGVAVETDLLCERPELDRLLDLPIDLILVRLNADRAKTYESAMGLDGFKRVMQNMEHLFNQRAERQMHGTPWIVPRLVKTEDTLEDLEPFFERWTMVAGHAILEPARSGCGCMPEQSPIPMAPPKRVACRQLARRMTVLSDGAVAQCDQDWHGRAPLGDTTIDGLHDIWRRVREPAEAHAAGRYHELTLCGQCREWHRP